MRSRCQTCKGRGFLEISTTCPRCKGIGKSKITVGAGEDKSRACKYCEGVGKIVDQDPCPDDCEEGYFYFCDFCGKEIGRDDNNVCETCEENPVVIKLLPPLDASYLSGEKALLATVTKIYDDDVYVTIGDRTLGIRGQFKTQNPRQYEIGQNVVVRSRRPIENKPNWKNFLIPVRQNKFNVKSVQMEVSERTILDIKESGINNVPGSFIAQILNVKHIKNGPTFFTFIDKTGATIQGTAFGNGNRRAYSVFDRYSVVQVSGILDEYKDRERFLIYSMRPVPFEQRQVLYEQLASVVRESGIELASISLTNESELLDKLKEPIVEAAKLIRKAVISGRNVLLRYHSPCVDGATAAFAIDYAIRALLKSRGRRPDEFRYVLRRLPLKSPVYETSDIIRDISFVLDGPIPGEKMPLVVLIDAGSSKESLPAYQIAKEYELPTILIDHHPVSDEVKSMVNVVVNPVTVTDEYRLSASMLGFELARFIYPDEDIAEQLYHVAAIGGVSDNIQGEELDFYLSKAEEKEGGLTREKMDELILALEYVLFGLRFSDGGEVIRDILQIGKKDGRADAAAVEIGKLSKNLIERALATMEAKAEDADVSDIKIKKVDLEKFAPRFEFPTHGLLISKLHNRLSSGSEKFITIGVGADYVIFRSNNVSIKLDEIRDKIQEKLPLALISGGGHDNVGTLRFLSGFKEEVIDTLLSLF